MVINRRIKWLLKEACNAFIKYGMGVDSEALKHEIINLNLANNCLTEANLSLVAENSELKKDKERLEFMLISSGYVLISCDGLFYYFNGNDAYDFKGAETKKGAIDNAMNGIRHD